MWWMRPVPRYSFCLLWLWPIHWFIGVTRFGVSSAVCLSATCFQPYYWCSDTLFLMMHPIYISWFLSDNIIQRTPPMFMYVDGCYPSFCVIIQGLSLLKFKCCTIWQSNWSEKVLGRCCYYYYCIQRWSLIIAYMTCPYKIYLTTTVLEASPDLALVIPQGPCCNLYITLVCPRHRENCVAASFPCSMYINLPWRFQWKVF